MKKKMIPLIAAAVIFTAGCIAAIAGVQLNSGAEIDYPELDMFSISDDNVGKTFSFSTYTDVMHSADTEKGKLYLMWVYSSPDADSELMVIGCDVKKSASADFQYAETTGSYAEKPMQFCGTVRKSNDDITEKLTASITWYYDYLKQIYGDTEGIINEEAFSESYENISPYYIDVKGAADGNIFIGAGCAAMVLSAAAVLVIFFGKKVFIVIAALVLISLAVLFVSVLGKLRTMASITEVSDGLYKMTCRYDYRCDKFLDADIDNIEDLIGWITKEHFFGIPIELDAGNFGCSAFTAETPEGDRLFGRNFDYEETDTLVFYTEPKDGYASYGVSDLKFFDIGTENGLEGNSLPAKVFMLAAPYVTMDGINEAGLGVGILQLDIEEVHQDNGKTDLLIFAAIRGILDKCADIDEALALLENYDIHSFLSNSYHLFITDRTGRSVIVEWTDEETFVVEDTVCTNDVMGSSRYYDPEWSCRRYDIIKERLAEKNGILTADEAMSAASDASVDKKSFGTEWSCVYDLDEFSFDICLDREYERKYSFVRDDFR